MKKSTDAAELKSRIKQYAKKIGLPIFGVTSPEPLLHLKSLLEKRRNEGFESPFEKNWGIEARCRPSLLLPSVKSIICVGMPYHSTSADSVRPLWGVSRFAWGIDYHIELKDKLEVLAVFLRSATGPGFKYSAVVDSVPLVERALAHRAGLGWYGKNNLLINPEYGSLFVIGELLTNVPLEPDSSLEADCGECNLCLDACPTGALFNPYELNANKCISCLTQVKNTVPVNLRELTGKAVFGCDLCQEVCPRNMQMLSCSNENLQKSPINELAAVFDLTEREFRNRFGKTGFSWGGKELLQRNAALALGSDGSEENIYALGKALMISSPNVRSHAAWSLGNIGGKRAVELLDKALRVEKDDSVREEIIQAQKMALIRQC